jgi:uncharacterized LabA/DUF88 family protein
VLIQRKKKLKQDGLTFIDSAPPSFTSSEGMLSYSIYTTYQHTLNTLNAQNQILQSATRTMIQCLESTGVTTLMNKFKRKDVFCKICGKTFDKYEEKQTDVMIATTLFEQLHTDSCDTIVLVTGDSDLIPAVKTGKKLFPQKKIVFAFPSSMTSKELKSLVSGSFTLNPNEYLKYQFPDPVVLSDGTLMQKPVKW